MRDLGITKAEIEAIKATYCSRDIYNANPEIKEVIDTLVDGTVYELPMGSSFNILFTLDNATIKSSKSLKFSFPLERGRGLISLTITLGAISFCRRKRE